MCVLLSTAEPSSFDDECDDDGIAIILIQLTCNPLTVHVSGGLTSISVPLWMTASPALPVVVRSSCDTGGHKLWSDKSVQVDRERERECERGRTSSFFLLFAERVVVIFEVRSSGDSPGVESGEWRAACV